MKTVSVISVGIGLFLSLGAVLDPILKGSGTFLYPLFIAGLLFILLGIFNEKNTYKEGGPYVAFAVSALLLMSDYIGIIVGELTIPCATLRHCSRTTYTLKDNPTGFWILFSIFIIIAIWCGVYGYFKLKKSSSLTHQSSGTGESAL
jgi:hypothetical protein